MQLALELRLELVAAVHLQILIVDDNPAARRRGDRAIDRLEAAREQIPVDREPAPPLTVVAVSDVELGARILQRRVGPREREASGRELIGMKEAEAVGERLRVD